VKNNPLDLAAQAARDYLEALASAPAGVTKSLAEIRAALTRPLPIDAMDPHQVIQELVADTRGALLGSAGGRFFAWAIGGTLPAALAADWLTATWDMNATLYACGPAAAVVEEISGEWLKEILGLPKTASFAFTTGCQMAHVTALAAARHHLLAQTGWNVEERGLSGAAPIRILASNPHGSLNRAVRLLGMGTASVAVLPGDEEDRLRPEVLHSVLDDRPTILVLQAADLNTGAFDPYRELIPLAQRKGVWVHIDGAYGLWANASRRFRHLTDGVELADSWATDGHKWLNVPYDCGYVFVRHPEPHRAAMSYRAAYLVHDDEARDALDWTPEWSRRARGFATYAALRELGSAGVAALVERCADHAQAVARALAELPGVRVLRAGPLNQAVVAFAPSALASDEECDAFTQRVVDWMECDGTVVFRATTWRGRRVMRVICLNWRTSAQDVATAVDAVARCLGALQ
jgi:glutamate/tyrosine decarboxylase-like PLP-dependent enzyme